MSLTILALAGSTPVVIVLLLLVALRWPAARAMGVGWAVASGLGLLLWRMQPLWWAASALYGALNALEIIVIVFGAVLLMNHLEGSGAVAAIRWNFSRIAEDRRVQVLLIGLGFVTLIEGAAGFGTPGVLAAPLMIALGYPPLAAAVFGVILNAPQPPFGAAGTPVLGGIGAVIDRQVLGEELAVGAFLDDVTAWSAVVTASALVLWGLVSVFLMLFWFGPSGERTLRGAIRGVLPVAPLALLLGALAGGTQWVFAWFFGPELPNIASGFVVLGVGVVLVRRGVLVPKAAWEFPARDSWPKLWLGGLGRADPKGTSEEETQGQGKSAGSDERPERTMSVMRAWTPYLVVALVLVATRWPGLGIAAWLKERTLDVPRIFGQDLSFSLRYLYLPGVIPFIPVTLLTVILHGMDRLTVLDAWRTSVRQILSPAATLIVAVSMAQVMIQSAVNVTDQPGMMQALSWMVARGAGRLLPAVAPWIGALGAFMTGSNTSSNVLFGALQHAAAAEVGVSRTITVAIQNVGGGIGNMVAVLNIAAICAVTYMTGMESAILRKALVPTIAYALFAGLAAMVLVSVLPRLY